MADHYLSHSSGQNGDIFALKPDAAVETLIATVDGVFKAIRKRIET